MTGVSLDSQAGRPPTLGRMTNTDNTNQRARGYLQAALAARQCLTELYEAGRATNPAVVADLHQQIGFNLKMGAAYAELAVADAVAAAGAQLVDVMVQEVPC